MFCLLHLLTENTKKAYIHFKLPVHVHACKETFYMSAYRLYEIRL